MKWAYWIGHIDIKNTDGKNLLFYWTFNLTLHRNGDSNYLGIDDGDHTVDIYKMGGDINGWKG